MATPYVSVHMWDDSQVTGGVQIKCKEPETVREYCDWYGIDPATLPNEIELLDRIREIVLANSERLQMNYWHADDWDPEKPACEEIKCGTTHCMAGWAQVLCENPVIRKLDPRIAGCVLIPSAEEYFGVSNETATQFLQEREYATQPETYGEYVVCHRASHAKKLFPDDCQRTMASPEIDELIGRLQHGNRQISDGMTELRACMHEAVRIGDKDLACAIQNVLSALMMELRLGY